MPDPEPKLPSGQPSDLGPTNTESFGAKEPDSPEPNTDVQIGHTRMSREQYAAALRMAAATEPDLNAHELLHEERMRHPEYREAYETGRKSNLPACDECGVTGPWVEHVGQGIKLCQRPNCRSRQSPFDASLASTFLDWPRSKVEQYANQMRLTVESLRAELDRAYRVSDCMVTLRREREHAAAVESVVQRLRERLYARMTTCCDQITDSCDRCANDDALLKAALDV